jgi:hypothetical protein
LCWPHRSVVSISLALVDDGSSVTVRPFGTGGRERRESWKRGNRERQRHTEREGKTEIYLSIYIYIERETEGGREGEGDGERKRE